MFAMDTVEYPENQMNVAVVDKCELHPFSINHLSHPTCRTSSRIDPVFRHQQKFTDETSIERSTNFHHMNPVNEMQPKIVSVLNEKSYTCRANHFL